MIQSIDSLQAKQVHFSFSNSMRNKISFFLITFCLRKQSYVIRIYFNVSNRRVSDGRLFVAEYFWYFCALLKSVLLLRNHALKECVVSFNHQVSLRLGTGDFQSSQVVRKFEHNNYIGCDELYIFKMNNPPKIKFWCRSNLQ